MISGVKASETDKYTKCETCYEDKGWFLTTVSKECLSCFAKTACTKCKANEKDLTCTECRVKQEIIYMD